MTPGTLLKGVVAVFLLVLPGRADDWRQFRGPDGQGHAVSGEAPLRWSESDNIAWKTLVEGRGWSSPVVLGEQIWLTTALETAASETQLRAAIDRVLKEPPNATLAAHVVLKAICLDRMTGGLVRAATLFDVESPVLLSSFNSYASPTPVAEPGRLYCDFGAMGTACLNTESGAVLWRRKLEIDHQVGPGSSPVLYRDMLILTRDGCDQQYITALNKHTGEIIWKTSRPPLATTVPVYRKSFNTPLVIQYDGVDQLIAPGAQWMLSYEPATGRELWRVDTGQTFSSASRPVYAGGLVFFVTAYGGSNLLAIRPGGRGDVTESHVQWESQRSVPKRSSPLAVGNELYMVADNGIASCMDRKTGEIHWTKRLGSGYSASPIHASGRIYFFSEDGATDVMQPGTEPITLVTNSLEGRILSTPAFVNGAIFLRTDTHLYRIQ